MNLKNLVEEAVTLSEKQKLQNVQNGGTFNIFEVANISTDEVKICRVLHDLLSPKGAHCQGSAFLKLFVEDVLKEDEFEMNMSKSELDNALVFREYTIPNNRRIDLLLEIGNKVTPIEVKINAIDQKNQLSDYCQIARNSKLYYLTLYGDPPSADSISEGSADEVSKDMICNISFAYDIIPWLGKCLHYLDTPNSGHNGAIKEILVQLQSSLKWQTKEEEDEVVMELKKQIAKSSEAMKATEKIINSIRVAKTEKMIELFNEIEQRVKTDLGIEKEKNDFDYAFENNKLVKTFYNSTSTTRPGISFMYKKAFEKDVDILLRIEIHQKIYLRYFKVVNGEVCNVTLENNPQVFSPNDIESEDCKWKYNWEYLASNDRSMVPDFRHPNEAFYDLFDSQKFDAYIEYILGKLKTFY